MERAGDERAFVGRNRERRREEDVIAAQAVNAALRWIGKHPFIEASLPNFFGDVFLFWKRLASRFVFHKFDAKKKPETADIANIRMRMERRKCAAQVLPCVIHALKKLVSFQIVEDRVARGGGHRM